MPNLYGVANSVPQLTYTGLIGGATIVCPAGTETNIIAVPVTALDHGVYYVVAWCNLCLSVQTTIPTALVCGIRINNGADIFNAPINVSSFVASTYPQVNFLFSVSPPAAAFWPPGGATIQISLNPTTNAILAQMPNSQAIVGIFRGPDQ